MKKIMDREERYRLAIDGKMISKGDLRAFALDILLKAGFDPTIVNFKEDGVSIEALNKLCRALYEVGYRDGFDESSSLRGKKREMEKTGKLLSWHKRTAKIVNETSQVNKIRSGI